MIRPELSSALLVKGLRMIRVIWGAMVGSILLFGIVLYTLQPPGSGQAAQLVLPLYVVAMMVGAGSLLLRRMPPEKLTGKNAGNPVALEQVLGVSATNDAERRALKLFSGIQTLSIVSFAMSEAMGLFGFTLSFLTGELTHYLALGGAALLLMLVAHFPARRPIEDALRKAEQSSGA